MAKISVPEEPIGPANDEQYNRNLAALAHWSFPIGFVVPFASIVIPLVLFNTTGKTDPYVKANAKEAINLFLYGFIMSILFLILCIVLIGFPLLMLLGLYLIIFPIIAAVQTMDVNSGSKVYEYPCIFRLLS